MVLLIMTCSRWVSVVVFVIYLYVYLREISSLNFNIDEA